MFPSTSPAPTAVGYKAESLRQGFTMLTTTFVNVSDADKGVDLCDLIPSGVTKANQINIQTLNYDGTTDKAYLYTKDRSGNWYWYDQSARAKVEAGTVFIEAGQGLWVNGIDDATLTNSGAVSTDDVTVMLRQGFTASGNMTPLALDLTTLVPNGVSRANQVNIQTLNSDGTTDNAYLFTKDRSGTWYWYDQSTRAQVQEGDVIFAPGQGLWINGIDGASITIPGPEL